MVCQFHIDEQRLLFYVTLDLSDNCDHVNKDLKQVITTVHFCRLHFLLGLQWQSQVPVILSIISLSIITYT